LVFCVVSQGHGGTTDQANRPILPMPPRRGALADHAADLARQAAD
jgi:hypothetical protein